MSSDYSVSHLCETRAVSHSSSPNAVHRLEATPCIDFNTDFLHDLQQQIKCMNC